MLELGGERAVEQDPVGVGRPPKRLVDRVEPAELVDRRGMVVGAQVDDDVREAGVAAVRLDDEERGGLLPAPVAAGRLPGGEAAEQPLGQREAWGPLERGGDRRHGLLGDEDVSLGCEAGAADAPGPKSMHAPPV